MSHVVDPREQHRSGHSMDTSPGHSLLPEWLRDAIHDTGDELPFDVESGPTRRRNVTGWVSKGLTLPKGAEPVVVRSLKRGVLHRGYRLDGRLHSHPRCHAQPESEVLPAGAEFWYDNLRDHGRLCRYPWCFRALVNELGIIPVVGHYSRKLRAR